LAGGEHTMVQGLSARGTNLESWQGAIALR
jgi:hypothetical protein